MTLRAAKRRSVAVPCAGSHRARPVGAVCRALRRAAPKQRTVCAAPRPRARTTAQAQNRRTAPKNVTAAGCDLTDGVYDLRPYRAGDSPKLIHWKLTARVGELTVREPLGAAYRADPAGSVLGRGGQRAAAVAALWAGRRKAAAQIDPPQGHRPRYGTGICGPCAAGPAPRPLPTPWRKRRRIC